MDDAPLPDFALLMEMGTGKSKVIVDEWGERVDAKDVFDLLIIAPAGCYLNWSEDRGPDEPSEFHKHLDPAVYEQSIIVPWRSGGGKGALDAVRGLLRVRDRPRVFVVNCEALSTVEKARIAARHFIDHSRKGVLIVVDESTIIKGESIRTEVIIELGNHPKVVGKRIMTGLVTPNSPLDLYWQFEFLNCKILGHRNFWAFKQHYAIHRELKIAGREYRAKDGTIKVRRGRNPQVIVAYRNVDELNAKIAPHSYRVLKKDCLDLPPKQYLPIRWVDFHPEQRRVYLEIQEFATAMLSSQTYVTAKMVLEQRLRLDQVLCGHVMDEEGVLREVPERRTDELLQVLGETMGRVIVWTSHDYSIRKISRRLQEEYGPPAVAQFWGGNRSTRHNDESRFKTDPRCRFMVATPAAGGRGNTWTGAGLSIFYNNSDNLEHRLQAEDRPHRDGLMGPRGAGHADYLDLAVPNTIDLKKIKRLRQKIDMATLVNNDPYQNWLI
jgi:hypothetical protein